MSKMGVEYIKEMENHFGIDPAKLQSWAKYQEEIDKFINVKQLADEMLYNAIVANSELVKGYANNVKHFSEQGQLIAIEDTVADLRRSLDNLSNLIREAKERAYTNSQ